MNISCKKISCMLFAVAMFFMFGSSAFALECIHMTNANGIDITETEYNNLLNLGFTDNEIQYMTIDEFLANKDLIGEIVAQEVSYENNSNFINPFSYQPGYAATTTREVTTTIVSVSDRYRYKVSVNWLQIPSNRSHDIIGIGIDTNVKIFGNLTYFQQNFCYSASNCSSSGTYNERVSSTGASATYQLPSASLVSMNSYFYFGIEKNTTSTITQLNAYGDFAHAMTTVSLSNAYNNHLISRGGLVLNSNISSYYDSIDTAKAVWIGSW